MIACGLGGFAIVGANAERHGAFERLQVPGDDRELKVVMWCPMYALG